MAISGSKVFNKKLHLSTSFANAREHLSDLPNIFRNSSSNTEVGGGGSPSSGKVNTMDMSHYFFPIFFSSEKRTMGIWDKQVGMGQIKRRVELDSGTNFPVLEISNPKQSTGTYIVAPTNEWVALHVSLKHLVIVMKNFRRNFSFEVQVLDSRGFLRRFTLATWFNPSNLKKFQFLCQLPLKLEVGWNEIHIDLDDLLQKTYKTKFFEVVKLVINANCRLRQVFFCGDQIVNGELPIPSMRLFENLKIITSFGPFNHPNCQEQGPKYKTSSSRLSLVPVQDPPDSRIEKDLRKMHIQRFKELGKLQMREPYKTHFKKLLAKSRAFSEFKDKMEQDEDKSAPEASKELPQPPTLAVSGISLSSSLNGPISLQQLIQNALTHPTTSTPKTLSQYLEDMRNKGQF